MPEGFEKTFIPRKSIDPMQTGLRIKHTLDTFLSASILFIALILSIAAALFVSHLYVEGQIKTVQGNIEQLSQKFDPVVVGTIAKLDAQVSGAEAIIASHTSIDKIFAFLDESTVAKVSIQKIDFVSNPKDGVVMVLSGKASSYNTLAYQDSVYTKKKDQVSDVVFSDIKPNEDGLIDFVATLTFTPNAFISNHTAL